MRRKQLPRRRWRSVIAVAAAAAVCLGATIVVYGRLHAAPSATLPPSPLPSIVPVATASPFPTPLPTMVPPPWIPEPVGAPPGPVDPYTVPPTYARTFPSGFGPPHAASVEELGTQPGCDPATSPPDPYGPCGWGIFTTCVDNPWTAACNQRLSNGTTCGFGLQDCIQAQLTCRLPLAFSIGGFLTFPSGTFTKDPASINVAIPGPGGGLTHPLSPISYDRPFSRWGSHVDGPGLTGRRSLRLRRPAPSRAR